MKNIRSVGALILLLLAGMLPLGVSAQDRALHWDRWDFVVDVQENGDLRYTERQIIVVDRGSFRFGTRSFDTGQRGRVRDVQVSENGQPYRPGAEQPGTFTAADNTQQFSLRYYFADPNATRHDLTISYTLARSLVPLGDLARFEWPFFCAKDCPQINAGSVAIQLPGTGGRLEAITNGAEVRQTESGATTRWELTGPIQNTQLRVQATFPRALLGPNPLYRSTDGAQGNGQGNAQPPARQPAQRPVNPAPNVAPGAGSLFSPIFCLVGFIALFVIFGSMRRSTRRRGYPGPPTVMGGPMGMPMGMPMDAGFPVPRRRRGFWGRRRYNDYGGYGGYGVPPIMPPVIITPPIVPDNTFGNPYNPASPQDVAPGGGNDGWGDSSGSGSWGDSGGGGSWGDASGGGSWGDSGGGGSWGDSGGGGNNDSSSFG